MLSCFYSATSWLGKHQGWRLSMLSLASQTNIHGSRFPPGRYPTSKKELALWSTSGCSSVLLSISGLSSASAFGYVATHILLSREEGIDLTVYKSVSAEAVSHLWTQTPKLFLCTLPTWSVSWSLLSCIFCTFVYLLFGSKFTSAVWVLATFISI